MKRPIAATTPRYSENGPNEVTGAGNMKGVAKPVATAMKPNISRRSCSAIQLETSASTTNNSLAAVIEVMPYHTDAAEAVTYHGASAPPSKNGGIPTPLLVW